MLNNGDDISAKWPAILSRPMMMLVKDDLFVCTVDKLV